MRAGEQSPALVFHLTDKMAGHVYLIGSSRFKWYKIGKSRNATIRLSQLGILLPFKVEVFAIWKTDSFHDLEQTLHDRYAKHRLNGEWFFLQKDQVRDLVAELSIFATFNASNFTNIDYKSVKSPEECERLRNEGILASRQKKAARQAGLDLKTLEQAKVLAKIKTKGVYK